MAQGEPYDDDRPARGSPRLMGSGLSSLRAYRRTAELRASGSPKGSDAHEFNRNLMIVLAVKSGLKHQAVAGVMGLSRVRVTNILREMESRVSRLPGDE